MVFRSEVLLSSADSRYGKTEFRVAGDRAHRWQHCHGDRPHRWRQDRSRRDHGWQHGHGDRDHRQRHGRIRKALQSGRNTRENLLAPEESPAKNHWQPWNNEFFMVSFFHPPSLHLLAEFPMVSFFHRLSLFSLAQFSLKTAWLTQAEKWQQVISSEETS